MFFITSTMQTEEFKKFDRAAFGRAVEIGALPIGLAGMSNTGKSRCAKLLADLPNFVRYNVDELIGESIPGVVTMEGLQAWLGRPGSQFYSERAAQYLALENTVVGLAKKPQLKNLVVDTTGSFGQLDETVISDFQDQFLVVGLVAPETQSEAMLASYREHPKPIVWPEGFYQAEDEMGAYQRLLAWRQQRTREMADVCISTEVSLTEGLTAEMILEAIGAQLPGTQ